MDNAGWVGDEESGVHYGVGEGPDGWYVTTVVDFPGNCDTMCSDDGPYESKEAATMSGKNQGISWCLDNHVSYDGGAFWEQS
jgi:hypothetical protein